MSRRPPVRQPQPPPPPPSGFALTRAELARERDRLRRAGWQPWEIDQTLARPADVPRGEQ